MKNSKKRQGVEKVAVDQTATISSNTVEPTEKPRKSSKEKAKRKNTATEKVADIKNVDSSTAIVSIDEPKKKKIKLQKSQPVAADNSDPEEEINEIASKPSKKNFGNYDKKITNNERIRTIFVGNLPVGVTRKDIQKMFANCGSIDSVRLRSLIPKDAKMLKKVAAIKNEISSDVKDNVNAYVKYKLASDAEKALKMNGHLFGGHRLQVDSCAQDAKYDNKRSVFIGNLCFTAKEDELLGHFADCGEIERVRIVRDSKIGVCKGFGFVVFKEPGCVEMALKLNGENFDNRPLRVTRLMKKFGKNKNMKKQKPGSIKTADSSKDSSKIKRKKKAGKNKKPQKSLMQ